MLRSKQTWQTALDSSKNNFTALTGTVTKFMGVYGTLAGVVAGGGLTILARNALNTASALKDTSDRLSLTTTELQRNQFAFKLAGVGSEQFETAITKLNAKIADGDLIYNSTSEALDSIAESVKNAKTEQEALAIVNDAFGNKIGAKLLPVLKQGADGLKALGDEAERTGNVISENTIKSADEFSDKLDILGASIKNNFTGGFLESFVGQSGDLKQIYDDPDFAKNIEAVGLAVGGITAAALNGVGAIGQLIIKYNELDEAGKKITANLDKGFFDKLDQLERKLRAPERMAQLDKQRGVGVPAFGPNKLGSDVFGPDPLKSSAPIPAYVSTEANKAAESAAKRAATEGQKRIDTTKQVIDALRMESEQLNIQISMFGKKESAIARAQKQLAIENQLRQAGIKISKEQQAAITSYLDSIEKQTELQAEQAKQQDLLKEKEQDRRQALNQLGSSFESAFEKAITDGEKLGDVLDSLLQDILKILTRVTITEPLGNAIVDAFSSSGGEGGGFLDSIFGSLPKFATGTNNVPTDMIAQIHKGEMIVPAYDASKMRNGNMGGGSVEVTVINNAGARVSTQSSESADGTELTVMVDQMVADAMGRKGSKTNQALGAYSQRALVRR